MLMHSDRPVMSLGKGLVMIWCEDMRFIVITPGSEAEIDDKLLGSPDSKVRMDEGNFFLHDK